MRFPHFFIRLLTVPLLLTHGAFAQSTLTFDLETVGQFAANFRTISAIGGGTAAQTTVGANTFFRQDATSGSTNAAYLFDQTPGDTAFATQSAFATTGPITVSFDLRAVTTNSSFAVMFADPVDLSNNVMGIFNVISGADSLRVFKDGVLTATGAGAGTQVGATTTATTTAQPNTGAFTPLSVQLAVSGTTPTLTVTAAGSSATFTFAAGDLDWAKTCVLIRLNDPSTSANTAVEIDNVVITSPAGPVSPIDPNTAPVLPAQANRTVAALSTLVVGNAATDNDSPTQTLSYTLTAAPPGAAISASGVITWTPTAADIATSPHTFTTQVTDDGAPPLGATNSFQVTVTAAPVYPFASTFDFGSAGDFSGNFRVLSAIGGGTFGPSAAGTLLLDANSAGASSATTFVFDSTPDDASAATQTALPTTEEIRISFLARAKNADSSFAVSFADPRNASNRITALALLQTGDDIVRFYRDGTLTASSNAAGTQVGSDALVASGAEPNSGVFVPVTAVFNVIGGVPTISLTVGDGAPVTSAFVAADLDWNPTLVMVRLADASTGNNTPVEIDNLVIAGGAPISVPAPILPPAPGVDGNLLTINPGFETGSLNNFSGSYSFTGWTGSNALFSNHAITSGTVAAGTVTQGTKKLLQSWGGTLATALTARPPATPGATYELRYDQRSLIRNFPNERLGTLRFLEFFDVTGVRLKQIWGTANDYKVQSVGKDLWETFALRAIAPVGTAYVGVRVEPPSGRFVSSDENYTQDRHVELDNFRLNVVPEPLDRLAIRRAPRLVEPGRTATLRINHATAAARTLRVALVNAGGVEVANGAVVVAAGRFRNTSILVPVPAGLANDTYAWRVELQPTGGSPAVATRNFPGVLVDETLAAPPLANNEFPANDPRIQYMGRIEELGTGQRWLHWFGSEVRARFTGSSITLRGTVNDNGFGAADPGTVIAVIDENFASPITVALDSFNFTKTIATGLSAGAHTLRLFKNTETDGRIRIDGLRVAAGGGLLRPEPLPARRIEIFGDSVTSGGTASPGYNGYAPLLGRELDADVHIISKGGTGVAASFSGQDILVNYWDNLSYPNVFNSNSSGSLEWTFGTWVPDAIVIAIGHNDQFNNGSATFTARYAEFKGELRAVYPDAQIVTANTLISANLGQFQNATDPLTSVDPRHIFAFQPNPWSDGATGHPPTASHAAQIRGDERHYSLADVVEDRLGAGLNAPLAAYEQWVVNEFSGAEIAAGWHAPEVATSGDGFTNLLRYALGLPAHGSAAASLPIAVTDAQGRLTLTFQRARADVSYFIEVSDDLIAWQTAAINSGAVGSLATFVDTTAPANATRRFARLRVKFL